MSYRILTLDGGGPWALLEALVLGDLYGSDTPGHDILAEFDLAAGTSAGAIVLGGLIKNLTPAQILDLFVNDTRRGSLFVKVDGLDRLVADLDLGPRYSTEGKLAGLTAMLDDPSLAPPTPAIVDGQGRPLILSACPMARLPLPLARRGDAPVKVFIPAFDYAQRRAMTFRSYAGLATAVTEPQASTAPLAEVINASSTAPVAFFDEPARCDGRLYWDGGLTGCNNPVMLAVMEALAQPSGDTDLQILSLGSGTTRHAPVTGTSQPPDDLAEPVGMRGTLGDLSLLAQTTLDDPPDTASLEAHILAQRLAGRDPATLGGLVRLNVSVQPVLQSGVWAAPPGLADGRFAQVAALPADAVDPAQIALIQRLGRDWMAGDVPNQPLITRLPQLDCVLGDTSYAQAKARWLAIIQT
ncbi:patatin-like phospholipase family protein [Nitrospirillum sp. BR 11164]|uniref:patatin-like phospholipase family protein n=1 Tax=Nitrospirillum sp. BR 11164 TaxID=3104324 RepID=UPI002AFE3387|nr:patatin-like phospholipase family protein [Nitrospirillum sp. BR 11164]MEA1653042.1 patatin-like phospholipase family protein [Nitrospirillum sp. BR 11164]